MISYRRLWELIKKREITICQLRVEAKLGGGTIENLQKNGRVTTSTLNSLCRTLKCDLNDIIEYIECTKCIECIEEEECEI